MTAEQEYIEHLEALVKRYRKRIIELKAALKAFMLDPDTLRSLAGEPPPDRKTP